MPAIEPIKMPKWGLAMEEGKIVEWWVAEGAAVSEGDDLVDIETSKITNVCEAHTDGVIRKIVAEPDETLPVGALLAVMADAAVGDEEINQFVEEFQANFVPEDGDGDAGGPDIQTIEAAGRSLRVGTVEGGSGADPVVLLHGFGGDLNNWMLVQPPLAAERSVYALELPGHGQSSKDVGDGSLASLGDIIIAGIDALGLDRFVLVGHSLGGAIATYVALKLGDRVSGLGLVCPAAAPGGQINSDYLNAFVSASRARDLRAPAKQLFADPDMVTRDMLEDLIRAKRLDGAEAALGAVRDGLVGGDAAYAGLANEIEKLTMPIALIASTSDQIVGSPDPAAYPASASVHWINEAGHMPHLEASGAVVDALKAL